MHLQQTKAKSRTTGGPQYYFHAVTPHVKEYLRKRGACHVVLQTPYGIARSDFMAIGKDHKLNLSGEVVGGSVGHDRIQQATGTHSIGEAIRHWYGLKGSADFERIDVQVDIHPEGHFILVPTAVLMRGRKRSQVLERVHAPLSFHRDYVSKLWKDHIRRLRRDFREDVEWAAMQIAVVVAQHRAGEAKHILESDLLRTAGALTLLGVHLSPYLGNGYDCLESRFNFASLPPYECPVEIKKRSAGFSYQVTRYKHLPRAIVLCMEHNMKNPPDHIDFIELTAVAEFLAGP